MKRQFGPWLRVTQSSQIGGTNDLVTKRFVVQRCTARRLICVSPAKQRVRIPAAALDWMLGPISHSPSAVLLLGSGKTQINDLLNQGHHVWALSGQFELLERAKHSSHPTIQRGLSEANLDLLVARLDAVPMRDCSVDFVLCTAIRQPMSSRSIAELARVLRPGGSVSGARLVRDDTVPWVQRLIALMQSIEPSAMAPISADETLRSLSNSRHFDDLETRDFRIWTEITRFELVDMAARSVDPADLSAAQLAELKQQVGKLYDDAAGPSGLRLPYQLRAWRLQVDHSELTTPVRLSGDDGLSIIL